MKIKYRLYADGSVYHQDEFHERDHSQPYYDDYEAIEVPEEVIQYITDGVK